MSFAYSKMIRQAALRVSAVKGSDLATKNTKYGTTPLTITEIGNMDFPPKALEDAAVSAVARLVRAYASVKNHPFRLGNLSQTSTIAHKGLVPATNSAGKPIVGVYGAVRNASTGEPMTENPVQIIKSVLGDSNLKGTYNYYKIEDGRFYGTASGIIDVVTFDEATERSALASGDTPLPDALFDAAWAALAAILVNDDAYTAQAAQFETFVQGVIGEIRSGATNFGPGPDQIISQNPEVN